MPEGHTIHGIAGRLTRAFAGRPVHVTSPQGRFAQEAELLDGRALAGADAAGKHLFVRFEGDAVVHVHLGLIGRFAVLPGTDLPVTGVVRMRLEDAEPGAPGLGHTADLRGPNRCDLVSPTDAADVIGRLGPDPLRDDADPERAWARVSRSRKPVAELLMDQAVVAGVGNVYRCEVLWRAGVDPFVPGNRLRRATWDELWDDVARLLPLGVAFNQILTMEDQVREAEAMVGSGAADDVTASLTGDGLGTFFERRFHLYQRGGEPCTRCGTPVATRQVAGRTLYWCPTCQPPR